MIPKFQDVILPHEHDKLLIVRAEGFVSVDESLYEPKEASVFVSFLANFCAKTLSTCLISKEAKMAEIALVTKEGDGHIAHRSGLPQRHPHHVWFCPEQCELVVDIN